MECYNCKSKKAKSYEGTSWISALFIALIPKCSLCVVAYGSAITMCGGQDLLASQSQWLTYLPLALSGLIFIMLLLNKKGPRTKVALVLAIIGSIIVLSVNQGWLLESTYQLGTFLLFMAIWVNGSFLAIFNIIKKQFTKHSVWSK